MRDRLLKNVGFNAKNRDMFHIQLSLMQNAENIRKDGNNMYSYKIQILNFELWALLYSIVAVQARLRISLGVSNS